MTDKGLYSTFRTAVETLREGQFRIEEAGEGYFIILFYMPTPAEEKQNFWAFSTVFEDVQWCPDPCSHDESVGAVLNCFYPRFDIIETCRQVAGIK